MTASNRREVFQFENYGEEDEYENQYFDEEKFDSDLMGPVAEVNMKKNKDNAKNVT